MNLFEFTRGIRPSATLAEYQASILAVQAGEVRGTGGGGALGSLSRGLGAVAGSGIVQVAAPVAGKIAGAGLGKLTGINVTAAAGLGPSGPSVITPGGTATGVIAPPQSFIARLLAFAFPRKTTP